MDFKERDPNGINNYVKILFERVIAEPEETSYSAKCLWENSNICNRFGKNCCYNFLSYIFTLPISLCWGCTFGITAFYHVWIFIPLLRLQSIVFHTIRKLISIILSVLLAPIFEAFGLFFGRIYVQQAMADPPRPFMERLHSREFVRLERAEPQQYVFKSNKVAPSKKNPPPPPRVFK